MIVNVNVNMDEANVNGWQSRDDVVLLASAVGILRHQRVYPREVELVFPVAARGRPSAHARLASQASPW
jgi:hypothetical protein